MTGATGAGAKSAPEAPTNDAFAPIDTLEDEDAVELPLVNNQIVVGRLLRGGIHGPATRSFYTRDGAGKLAFVRPVGWRELPARAVTAQPETATEVA